MSQTANETTDNQGPQSHDALPPAAPPLRPRGRAPRDAALPNPEALNTGPLNSGSQQGGAQAPTSSEPSGRSTRHGLVGLFWSNFFTVVLLLAATAQWVCVAWLAVHVFGADLGPLAHLGGLALGAVLTFALRRRPARGSAPAATSRARRIYTGFAFACMFGFGFLVLNTAFWGVAWAGLSAAGSMGLPVTGGSILGTAYAAGTAGLATVVGAIAYGYALGQRRVWVSEFDVAMPHLAPSLDGLRLVQISDIHLGNYMTEETIEGYVEQVNALGADLICITGDITDGLEHAPRTFPALGGLRARLGVVAILGNHDEYTGADQVEAALGKHTDFTVLRDNLTVIAAEESESGLWILGVNDLGYDWARGVREHPALPALHAQVPADSPVLLLSHRPDLFAQAAGLNIGLVLAGHTHGGQLGLPWPGTSTPSLAHFMTPYPRGTYRRGSSTLHVNLGLGVTAQPVRVSTPREITLITLRSEGEN